MNNTERLKAVEDFLYWLESGTYYEIGKDVQSDYGDGESNFYRISAESLIKEYKDFCNELENE